MQYHQYYGLQVIHCRRLSKIQQVLLPHMVSNWGLPAPDCHFSDLQDLLTRAATTAFTTALAMSLHLGVRLAAPKHNRAYFNSIVLQLHIPPDTASTAINPPIPIYFLKKKKKIAKLCVTPADNPPCSLHSSLPWHRWLWLQRCFAVAQFQLCPPQLAPGHQLQNQCNMCIFRALCSNSNRSSLFSK